MRHNQNHARPRHCAKHTHTKTTSTTLVTPRPSLLPDAQTRIASQPVGRTAPAAGRTHPPIAAQPEGEEAKAETNFIVPKSPRPVLEDREQQTNHNRGPRRHARRHQLQRRRARLPRRRPDARVAHPAQGAADRRSYAHNRRQCGGRRRGPREGAAGSRAQGLCTLLFKTKHHAAEEDWLC